MPYTRISDFPTDPTGTKPVCPDCASALTIGGALSKNGGVATQNVSSAASAIG
jgi:hypothetical protein